MPMPNLESLRALLPAAGVEARRHLPGALGGAAIGGVGGATIPDAEDGGERARNALIGALVGGAGGAGASRLMKGPGAAQLGGGAVPKQLSAADPAVLDAELVREHRPNIRAMQDEARSFPVLDDAKRDALAMARYESAANASPAARRAAQLDAINFQVSNKSVGGVPIPLAEGPGQSMTPGLAEQYTRKALKESSFQKRAFFAGIQDACKQYQVVLRG